MSWNTAKKRFQKDIDKYPQVLREVFFAKTSKFTLPTFDSKVFPVPKSERKQKLEEIGVASGDVAYITEGEKKGTLSTIFQYSPELNAVLLSDVTSKKIIPKANWVDHQSTHLMDYPEYVPLSHIKLAAKDKDEKGNLYYVVADDVVFKDRYYDDRYKKWLPRRYVKHHENIEIPWPSPPQEPKEDDLSTTEDAVFEKTYELQTIARSPIPKNALDQLRNPYSSYKKRTLSRADLRKIQAPEMPLSKEQKIYLAKKAAQPEKKYNKLSEEVQEYIGSRIADRLNSITNPALLTHLKALSDAKVPDFEKTIQKIEQSDHQSQ